MIDPKDMIDALILNGALEISAMDSESGQMVYAVTDKMAEVAPEIYKEISDQTHRDVMSLWSKGLLVVDIMSNSPDISLTELALDRANWIDLSDSEYSVMNTVMRMFEGGFPWNI
jgi:hypothetical protein